MSYIYELWEITSVWCTFVVNDVASTMKRQTHCSCMTLHNGLPVWLLHSAAAKTYKQYLTNNEPGTTGHILYKKIILKLLLIHAINKLGV